jgi:phosphotransferase system IIB component
MKEDINMMKNRKKVVGIVLCITLLISSTAFASGKNSISQVAVKQSSNSIGTMINDSSPWTAHGKVSRNNYTGYAQSDSRVTGTTNIRDIDYIYVRVRGYYNDSSLFTEEKSYKNAADVSVSKKSDYTKPTICYGTHEFKEEGYNDIFLETSE